MHFLKKHSKFLAGGMAGAVNGLLGTGGGMLLIPIMTLLGCEKDEDVFAVSVSVILPISTVSLLMTMRTTPLPLGTALPYMLGAIPGGVLAVKLEKKIPLVWLHRILGALILWGGMRFLW